MQLALAVTRILAKPAIIRIHESKPAAFPTHTCLDTPEVVGAQLEAVLVRLIHAWEQNIERAVQAVGTMERSSRTANHFDAARQLGREFEHLVDVAETGWPGRHTILENEEGPAGTRSRQDRRANRRQVLLAAAADDPDTRDTRQQFVDVRVAACVDGCGVEHGDITHVLGSGRLTTRARDDDFLDRAGREGNKCNQFEDQLCGIKGGSASYVAVVTCSGRTVTCRSDCASSAPSHGTSLRP